MANNIVSKRLAELANSWQTIADQASEGCKAFPTNNAKEFADSAAKLDRLVEAAEVVRDSDHCECKGCVEIFNALDDALTHLELPKKSEVGE